MRGRTLDNDAIRDEASQILENKDFRQFRPKEENFLQDLWDWFKDLFDFGVGPASGGDPMVWKLLGGLFKVGLILLLLFAVGYLAYWLFGLATGRKNPEVFYGVSEQERKDARDSYTRLADDAFRSGDYRLAVHYLLLAAVSMVIRDNSFHTAEYLTNRELVHASDFSGRGNASQLNRMLHDMVLFDEPAWFGDGSLGEDDYRKFSAIYRDFQSGLQGAARDA